MVRSCRTHGNQYTLLFFLDLCDANVDCETVILLDCGCLEAEVLEAGEMIAGALFGKS